MMGDALKLLPFRTDEFGISFKGAYAFSSSGKNLLLNDYGYTLILDDDLFLQIKNQNISEELAMLLIQRRFAEMDDMPFSIAQADTEIHPVFFMIDLTNRCNMACKYCLRDGDDSITAKVITSETVDDVCAFISDYCKKNNEDQITIQPWGGEPLLEKDKIFQIQDNMRSKGIDPCITIETNGLLLNDELISELRRRNIWTSVSIDGPAHIHDNQRVFRSGKPTHSVVEKNLIKLRDAFDGRVSVIATVTRDSCGNVREIIRYLVTELKLQNIKVNFVHKSSFVDNDDLCMSGEEIGECTLNIFRELMELTMAGYTVSDYNIHTKIMNVLYNLKTDVCICSGCHGGRKMITFDSRGDVYPCDVTDYKEECLGSIYDNTELTVMVEKAVGSKPYFREKKQEKCKSCPWYCYCRGGCTVHVKTQGKQPPATDEIECAVNRALYPMIIETILEHPEQINRFLRTEAL